MILRKPYAFLIKHFKLLHIIIVIPMIYLLFKSNMLIEFINEYMASPMLIVGGEFTETLFETPMFVLNFLIIIVALILAAVMYNKKKPLIYYLFTVVVYLALCFLYVYSYSVVGQMQEMIVDSRLTRALHDILYIAYFVQLFNIIQTMIRATGFDIKKFNFNVDLKELDISSEDNEEFEFEMKINTNKIANYFKKHFRFMKYVYIENRLVVDCIGLALVAIIATLIFLYWSVHSKHYGQDSYFNTSNFTISIDDAYVVDKSYTGATIGGEDIYVVIRANIKSRFEDDIKLNTGLMQLVIDDEVYYHSKDYRYYFTDMGNVYNNFIVPMEETEYLFVYKIPFEKRHETMYFRYLNDVNATGTFESKYLKVKLVPEDLTLTKNDIGAEYNKEIIFNNTLLLNSKLNISSIDVAEYFQVKYDYCLSSKECIDSVEYIRPTINTNYDKALIRIKGEIDIDKKVETNGVDSMFVFLNTYGTIEYTVDGKPYKQRVLTSVKPSKVKTKNSIFIEVNKDILKAESISLKVNVRTDTYKYVIK